MPGSFPPPLGALTTSLPPDRGETLALQQFPSFPSLSFFLFPFFFLFPLPFLRAVLRPGSSCPRRAAKQPPTPTRDSPAVRRRGVLEGQAGGDPESLGPAEQGGLTRSTPPFPPRTMGAPTARPEPAPQHRGEPPARFKSRAGRSPPDTGV